MKRQILARFCCSWILSVTGLLFAIPAQAAGNNILVIIADDLGVDMLKVYGRSSDTPPTPNIDALRANGIMFRNAWSNPFCSPTRATIQTGQYGLRTGVGFVTLNSNNYGLPLADPSIKPLPRVLNQNPELGYSHAAIGKWHLSNSQSALQVLDPTNGLPDRRLHAPNDAGWSYFSGNWSYMGGTNVDDELDDYFAWQKLQNGTRTSVGSVGGTKDPAAYATTVNVNDTIHWVNQRTGPWLLYLAFNSPHFPYHAPPPGLLSPPRVLTDNDPKRLLYKAMIEAMDTEIGRLVKQLGPTVMAKTTVIFLGDNGTPKEVVEVPPDPSDPDPRYKGSLYEGGINVPLIISGAEVKKPNRESQALVNTTDLYATILDLAGVDLRTALGGAKFDSVSLKPILSNTYNRSLRKYNYAELFKTAEPWTRAIRNERFKLIRINPAKESPFEYNETLHPTKFFDLMSDPLEKTNLLDNVSLTDTQRRNLDDLRAQLDALVIGTDKWILPNSFWARNIVDFLLD